MKKKIVFGILIFITIIILITRGLFVYFNNKGKNKKSEQIETISKSENVVSEKEVEEDTENDEKEENVLKSTEEINLRDVDGKGTNYVFTYKNKEYKAVHTKDNWHIVDSYEITSKKDIEIICKALTDIHPIHGEDMKAYRTVYDLADEWIEHNIAYMVLPEGNKWRDSAKDVDLNPEDQNKSFIEIYENRTGEKLDINEIIKSK